MVGVTKAGCYYAGGDIRQDVCIRVMLTKVAENMALFLVGVFPNTSVKCPSSFTGIVGFLLA